MKKLILLTALLVSTYIFSQGKIHIFNYTIYNLGNSLVGSNTAAGCYPSVSGHTAFIPPGESITYEGYYKSGSPYKIYPIENWSVYSASGAVTNLPHTSPVLNIAYAPNTTWQLNKFSVRDVTTGISIPYGGESIGTLTCGATPITTVGGPGSQNPFQAFWFTSNGDTYFIIQ